MNQSTINSHQDIKDFILGLESRLFNTESPYTCGFGVYDNTPVAQVEFEYIRDYVLFHSNFEMTVDQYGRLPNGQGDYQGQHLALKYARKFILFPKSVSYSGEYDSTQGMWVNSKVVENSQKKWGDKTFEDYRMFRINKREKKNRSQSKSIVSQLEEQLKKNSEEQKKKNSEGSVNPVQWKVDMRSLDELIENVGSLTADDLRTLKRAGEILTQLTSSIG